LSVRQPIASLPMYDWPEIRWANDALWSAIALRLAEAGMEVPSHLDRSRAHDDVWRDPDLILSQTCGFPFSTQLIGKACLVGTPVYAVEGCSGPFYSTVIVARKGDGNRLSEFRGRRFAVNSEDSLSGHVALRVAMLEAGLDPAAVEWVATGSHRNSIRAVAAGEADIASIDAVCWALAKDYEGEAVAELEVVTRTPLRPGLPLLTALREGGEVDKIRGAIREALADPVSAAPRAALHLSGIAALADADYAALAGLLQGPGS
jgi:ABC-type phosphate/phosphonate transport system substrate-binding protein